VSKVHARWRRLWKGGKQAPIWLGGSHYFSDALVQEGQQASYREHSREGQNMPGFSKGSGGQMGEKPKGLCNPAEHGLPRKPALDPARGPLWASAVPRVYSTLCVCVCVCVCARVHVRVLLFLRGSPPYHSWDFQRGCEPPKKVKNHNFFFLSFFLSFLVVLRFAEYLGWYSGLHAC
jgi:hypothetical protein